MEEKEKTDHIGSESNKSASQKTNKGASAAKKKTPVAKSTKPQKGEKKKDNPQKEPEKQKKEKTLSLKNISFGMENISLAMANLNIFGLGYLLGGKVKRWLIWLAGCIGLLAAGHILNASKNIALWAALFIVYFLAMAIDLFLLLQREKPQVPGFLKSSKYFLPAAALLINAVFYGGFIVFRNSGYDLYQHGMDAFERGDFSAAVGNWHSLMTYYPLSLNKRVVDVEHSLNEASVLLNIRNQVDGEQYQDALENIALFNVVYPETTHQDFVKQVGLDAYVGFSAQQLEQEEFESSLETLQTAAVVYPDLVFENPSVMEVAYNQLYLGWAQYLSSQDDFTSAIPKFEFVLTSFPDSSNSADAYEGAAQAYYGLSSQLSEDGQHEDAALALEIVLDNYEDAEAVESVKAALPEAYLEWGKELREDQQLLAAMAKFEDVSKLTQADRATKQNAQAEYEKTIPILARDSGIDGKQILNEAKEAACSGKTPTHPAVAMFAEEPGKFIACDSLSGSPKAWLEDLAATSPGEFLYTVFTSSDSERLQSCPYTAGHTLYRMRWLAVVEVKSVLTGESIAEKTFHGAAPDSCPFVHTFYGTTDEMYGGYPEQEDVLEWLKEVVE